MKPWPWKWTAAHSLLKSTCRAGYAQQSLSSLHLTWWRALPRRNTPLFITILLTPCTETQNGCSAKDKVLLAFNLPSWAAENWLTATTLLCAGEWALPQKDVRGAEIPEVIVALVSFVTALRKWVLCFPGALYFLLALLACPACWAQNYFAHWVTREIKNLSWGDRAEQQAEKLPYGAWQSRLLLQGAGSTCKTLPWGWMWAWTQRVKWSAYYLSTQHRWWKGGGRWRGCWGRFIRLQEGGE